MADTDDDAPLRVAMLLEFLARYGMAGRNIGGLSNAQWAALRYFERFNRFSRTLAGFAVFYSTTRASASQTISGLVKNGYLKRLPDERDGRSFRFELTAKARKLCVNEQDRKLPQAIAALSAGRRAELEDILQAVLSQMEDSFQDPVPGGCGNCRYFRDRFDPNENVALSFCARVRSDLEASDIETDCIHYAVKV